MNDSGSGSGSSPISGSPVVVNQYGVGNSAVGAGDDPYFVNNNELTGNSIVSKVLLGQENYAGWKRQMEIALSGRSKLSFIQGKYPKPDDAYMAAKWQRCNDVVMSWLICSVSEKIVEEILHARDVMTAWEILESSYAGTNLARKSELQRELGNLVQGDLSVAMYKRKLESLWQELDALKDARCLSANNCPRCKQVDEDCKSDRVIKFLMGLNDEYASVRTHVFALSEVPKFSTVYGLALSEEASRKARQISKVEGSALTVQADQANNSQLNNGSSGQTRQYSGQTRGRDASRGGFGAGRGRSRLFCSHCQMPGHLKENCYKLNGYPQNYRMGRNDGRNDGRNLNSNTNNSSAGKYSANAVASVSSDGNGGDSAVKQFTSEQMEQLLAMIKGNTTFDKNNVQNYMASSVQSHMAEKNMADLITVPSSSSWEFSCDLEVDFKSDDKASIVYTALAVDKELQPDKVKRQMTVADGKLSVHFEAIEARFLRASFSAFMDVLTLATKTIEEFGQGRFQ